MSARRSNGREVVVPAREDVLESADQELARIGGVAYPVAGPVAGPVQRGEITVRHVYDAPPAAPPVAAPPVYEQPRPTWATAAGFMAVVCILLAIGVGLWFAQAAPWETDANRQQQTQQQERGAGR